MTSFSLVAFVFALLVKSVIVTSSYEVYQEKSLKAHNEYRKIHHSPALELDPELNEFAIECAHHYAKIDKIDHSCPGRRDRQLGENLYKKMCSGGKTSCSNEEEVALKSVKNWYEEIKNYDFDIPSKQTKTGHFTQVVWKESEKLGVGVVSVKNGKEYKFYSVALYSPSGNMKGEYKENVLKP